MMFKAEGEARSGGLVTDFAEKEVSTNSIESEVSVMLDQLTTFDVRSDADYDLADLRECENSNMPPPKTYVARSMHVKPSNLLTNLSRSQSTSPPSRGHLGREFLVSRKISQSMPNLHTSRSIHNRHMGYELVPEPSERSRADCKAVLQSRIEEFDNLLDEL